MRTLEEPKSDPLPWPRRDVDHSRRRSGPPQCLHHTLIVANTCLAVTVQRCNVRLKCLFCLIRALYAPRLFLPKPAGVLVLCRQILRTEYLPTQGNGFPLPRHILLLTPLFLQAAKNKREIRHKKNARAAYRMSLSRNSHKRLFRQKGIGGHIRLQVELFQNALFPFVPCRWKIHSVPVDPRSCRVPRVEPQEGGEKCGDERRWAKVACWRDAAWWPRQLPHIPPSRYRKLKEF